MVGVAVKVTELLAQVGLAPLVKAILTAGVTVGSIVIVIEFEVAGLPVTPLRLEVITQVTTDPVASVVVVYVALLVPTLVPFTFH